MLSTLKNLFQIPTSIHQSSVYHSLKTEAHKCHKVAFWVQKVSAVGYDANRLLQCTMFLSEEDLTS